MMQVVVNPPAIIIPPEPVSVDDEGDAEAVSGTDSKPVVVVPDSVIPDDDDSGEEPEGSVDEKASGSNDIMYLAIIGILAVLVLYLFLRGSGGENPEDQQEST
jgi:hypothetical protein